MSANFCTAPKREKAEAAKEAKTAEEKEKKKAFEFSPRRPTS